MRHINLKKVTTKKGDFKVVPYTESGRDWALVLYKKTGQFVDHDFVARETDMVYSGVWASKKAARDFIAKHTKE